MSQSSFSAGHQRTVEDLFASVPSRVEPYDATHQFNRVVYSKPNKPLYDIYSVDPLLMLQAIERDQLGSLFKLTLLGREIMPEHIADGGTGIWDTMFNSTHQKAMSACIFMATEDYKTIPLSRVAITSQYLNYSMLVSRMQKNKVLPTDRIGVGIHDLKEQLYYILLYKVDDLCEVLLTRGNNKSRPFMQPACNVTMEHACRIEYDGKMTIVDMIEGLEFDNDKAMPFVSWITHALQDITDAYPFKPHFIPVNYKPSDSIRLAERLNEEATNAQAISYAQFKDITRSAYDTAQSNKANALPTFEVATSSETGDVFVKLGSDYNPEGTVYTFAQSEMDTDALTEPYLINADLTGVDDQNVTFATRLPKTDTNPERIVRYFRVYY